MKVPMSSEMLVSQAALADRDGWDATAVGDDVAISVRSVGKMYYLYNRPQDRLKQAFLWGRKKLYREFWALRDVSFEVRRGEALGIIGRNGAGKSTLLQIVAGTLKPTAGEVQINGRVAALLELGSGFNPEFTGRENVYLNGAILGFSRQEMDERFDEIAAFADIGDFIDQPVKLYSSGMYVRLAFAVQAFVDAEVLIVDEAIAVGDVYFQMKCFRHFKNIQAEGVAIVFVSHDLATVKQYCDRAILLDQGRIVAEGDPNDVTNRYFQLLYGFEKDAEDEATLPETMPPVLDLTADRSRLYHDHHRYGDGKAKVVDFFIRNGKGQDVKAITSCSPCSFLVRLRVLEDIAHPVVGLRIKTVTGVDAFAINTDFEKIEIGSRKAGEEFYVEFSQNLCLAAGYYFISAAIGEKAGDQYIARDHRADFFRIYVSPSNCSTGIVNLSPKISIYDQFNGTGEAS
jgi:ABC-type polysaccharide/polyol phosphate transport system ATPase subunit